MNNWVSHWVSQWVILCGNIFRANHKSWNFERRFTFPHLSDVACNFFSSMLSHMSLFWNSVRCFVPFGDIVFYFFIVLCRLFVWEKNLAIIPSLWMWFFQICWTQPAGIQWAALSWEIESVWGGLNANNLVRYQFVGGNYRILHWIDQGSTDRGKVSPKQLVITVLAFELLARLSQVFLKDIVITFKKNVMKI